MRTCQLLLMVTDGLSTFLELAGVEPMNSAFVDAVFSAGEHALRQSVILRKIREWPSNSRGVQFPQAAIGRSSLLTVTTTPG